MDERLKVYSQGVRKALNKSYTSYNIPFVRIIQGQKQKKEAVFPGPPSVKEKLDIKKKTYPFSSLLLLLAD